MDSLSYEVLVMIPPACSAVQPSPSQRLPVTSRFRHVPA